MVLLDGKEVESSVIDPAKHRFIGMFRKPYDQYKICGAVACPCGTMLLYLEPTYEHYQRGHWDEPQYVTIEEEKK